MAIETALPEVQQQLADEASTVQQSDSVDSWTTKLARMEKLLDEISFDNIDTVILGCFDLLYLTDKPLAPTTSRRQKCGQYGPWHKNADRRDKNRDKDSQDWINCSRKSEKEEASELYVTVAEYTADTQQGKDKPVPEQPNSHQWKRRAGAYRWAKQSQVGTT
jgi:hypothetical protein